VGAVGPSFFSLNRPRGLDRVSSRVKFAMDFGYHFWKEFEGPAIGATIEQTFDDNFYTFHPGFKFWWDIQVVEDLEISVAPFADVGYMLATGNGFTDHAFVFGVGAEGRIVFNDRWVVLFRPIHLQTLFGDFFGETFILNYSILVGGGVAF
jgi:hypothetical protein